MKISAIARRYAQTLYDAAQEAGQQDSVGEQLQRLNETLTADPGLADLFHSPALSTARKRELLSSAFPEAENRLLLNFCCVLWQKGREKNLPMMAAAYRELQAEAAGLLPAQIVSALPLSSEQAERLNRALQKHFGRPLAAEYQVDPDLIGGVRVQVGDTVLDGSVRARLKLMKRQLQGAAEANVTEKS